MTAARPATNAVIKNPRQHAGFSFCGVAATAAATLLPRSSSRIALSMAAGLRLNGSCWSTAHREMRAERMAQDMDTDVLQICPPRRARD